jgi:hypothetical protein
MALLMVEFLHILIYSKSSSLFEVCVVVVVDSFSFCANDAKKKGASRMTRFLDRSAVRDPCA